MTQTLPAGLTATSSVAASSANLGPGFDSLVLALSLYDEIVVETTESGLNVKSRVKARVMCRWTPRTSWFVPFSTDSGRRTTVGGLNIRCHNKIPQSRGLGSSAAAVVGGLAAVNGLVTKWVRNR